MCVSEAVGNVALILATISSVDVDVSAFCWFLMKEDPKIVLPITGLGRPLPKS